MKEFESILKEIFFYSHEFGHNKFLEKNPGVERPDKKTYSSYFKYCHEGFYKAQDIIIDQLILVQKSQKDIKLKHKNAKGHKESKKAKRYRVELHIESHKELLLRLSADSIAWQLIQGQHYIAKRLFAGENQPTLLGNNLDSLLNFIKRFKEKHPEGFCLISDTTSFIQTGDMVCKYEGSLEIVEVKSGTINEKILNIIEKGFPEGQIDFCKIVQKKGVGFVKQFSRVLNQEKTLYEVSNIIKNDEGFDPRLKKKIKIHDPGIQEQFFFESISKLLKNIKHSKSTYAIDIIEKCLYIGVYKDIGQLYGPRILKMWMNEKTNSNYPVTNFLSMLKNPIKQPITYKPFDKEMTFDILFNRVSIYIGINFDYLFEFAKLFDLKMEWVQKKKLGKLRQEKLDVFRINKKGISIANRKNSIVLGDTFFTRIIHDFVLPSNLLIIYKTILEQKS